MRSVKFIIPSSYSVDFFFFPKATFSPAESGFFFNSCSYHGTAKPKVYWWYQHSGEKNSQSSNKKKRTHMTFNMFHEYHTITMWLFKWTSDFSTDRITITARCCNSIISMFQRLLTPDPGEQRLIPRSPRCTASLAVRLNPKLTWHVSQNRGLIPQFTGVLKINAPREQNRKLASESVRV